MGANVNDSSTIIDNNDHTANKDELSLDVERISCFLAGDLEIPDNLPVQTILHNSSSKIHPISLDDQNTQGPFLKPFIYNEKSIEQQGKTNPEEVAIYKDCESCCRRVWEHTVKYFPINDPVCQNIFYERIRRIGQLANQALRHVGFFTLKELLGPTRANVIHNWATTLRSNYPMVFGHGKICKPLSTGRPIRTDMVTWFSTDEVDSPASSTSGYPEVCLLTYYVDAIVQAMGLEILGRDGNPAFVVSRSYSILSFYPKQAWDTPTHTGFLAHYDNPDSLSDGRILTALYYLNPVWRKDWGGQLIIWPRPSHSTHMKTQPMSVLPTLDRLVLFYSDQRTSHRVQPVHPCSGVENRIAIAVWYFDKQERNSFLLQQKQLAEIMNG